MRPRRERLQAARLYLVCEDRGDEFLQAALRGGVDVVQLRLKDASEAAIMSAASRFKAICQEHDALLIVNDWPHIAAAVDADGAHLGQDDMPVLRARRLIGADRLIGLSTHTTAQIDAAARTPVDYIGVGPVHETPTKPGRPAVGLELVSYAAAHASVPFFAIGGISAANLDAVRRSGADRVAVVRALTEAADPEAAARKLRDVLHRPQGAPVGAA